jgi:hypothetical protein
LVNYTLLQIFFFCILTFSVWVKNVAHDWNACFKKKNGRVHCNHKLCNKYNMSVASAMKCIFWKIQEHLVCMLHSRYVLWFEASCVENLAGWWKYAFLFYFVFPSTGLLEDSVKWGEKFNKNCLQYQSMTLL